MRSHGIRWLVGGLSLVASSAAALDHVPGDDHLCEGPVVELTCGDDTDRFRWLQACSGTFMATAYGRGSPSGTHATYAVINSPQMTLIICIS